MTARTCLTCKHYEPSAMWRRGWCRNPRLYSPQESHLVDQDSLDCSRGLGSLWEPAEGNADQARSTLHRGERRPLALFARPPQFAPAGAGLMASAGFGTGGGAAGNGGDGEASHAGPPRPDQAGPSAAQERAVSFQPEERYWTDYLRVALPVIGLLILLGLLWYWATDLIGGGSDSELPTSTPVLAAVTPINAPTATPVASPTAPTLVATQGLPTPTVPINPTVPPAPTPQPTPRPPDGASLPVYEVGETVVTTDVVNMRAQPTTDSAIVEEVPAGTSLEITGEFVEAGELDWWPVRNPATGASGFIREDLLRRPDQPQ